MGHRPINLSTLSHAAVLTGAIIGAASCANGTQPTAEPVSQKPAAICPYDVTEAAAWINRMPSISERTKFHVVLRLLGEPGAACPDLKPIDNAKGANAGEIILNLEADEQCPAAAGAPFEARYSEPVIADGPKSITVICGGSEVAKIEEVESVY